MNKPLIVDSNFWVALFDQSDVHAQRAASIWEIIKSKNIDTMILDCIVNETFSAVARRFNKKGRQDEIKSTFERMFLIFKPGVVQWIFTFTKDTYTEVIGLMEEHKGIFNFHDALIALFAKQQGLKYILSFDRHFDLFPWIKRISEPDHLKDALRS